MVIEHSERLNNKINACMTFLTILGSGQVLLWTQFKNFNLHFYSTIYICLCVVSLIFFIISSVKFYKSFSGYKYNYFPIKEMALKHKNLITMICISFIVTAIVFLYGVGIDYYETNYVDQNTSHVIIDGGELNCQTMK